MEEGGEFLYILHLRSRKHQTFLVDEDSFVKTVFLFVLNTYFFSILLLTFHNKAIEK